MKELKELLDRSRMGLTSAIHNGELNGVFKNKRGQQFRGELFLMENVIRGHIEKIEKGVYGQR